MNSSVEAVPLDLTAKIGVRPKGTQSAEGLSSISEQVLARRLGKAGGLQVFFVVAQESSVVPDALCDRSGYVIVLLLSGSAMLGHEYLEGAQLMVLAPGQDLPELLAQAQAVVISLGPKGQMINDSRLKVSLADVLPFEFSVGSSLAPFVGRTLDTTEGLLASDVDWTIRSEGKNRGEDRPHKHPSGGEMILVLSGGVRDRGWDLKPFDMVLYGPLTSHGPSFNREGGMALTVCAGTYE